MIARVLVCAGSDSGAGAGIQADLKTVMALGGYATTAITAVTAQNTLGVQAVEPVSPGLVNRQIQSVLEDIGADAIKTGMLVDAAIVAAVASGIEGVLPGIPLVVDPVLISTSGTPLLDADGVAALRRLLFPRATLLTPNLPEAEFLLGRAIPDFASMAVAACELLTTGTGAVLLKGGHLAGPEAVDVLATAAGVQVFRGARIDTSHGHGTGCTLASAIATGLAQGLALVRSVERARSYVAEALRAAPGLGHGRGPLGHGRAP
jgi:hydroxymethylpyrimidine/phosphomethylpyrimidine kinase